MTEGTKPGADTEAVAKAEAYAKTAADGKAALDAERDAKIAKVRGLAEEISSFRPHQTGDLIKRLKKDEGLKITKKPKKGGVTVSMLGLKAKASTTEGQALVNWAKKARRALLQAA